MANEITVSASLAFLKGSAAATLAKAATKFTVSGAHFSSTVFNVPTTAGGTAIPLGSVTAGGWCFIQNNDPTNYVQLLTAVSGTAFMRLMPGEFAAFRIDAGLTAPAALAHTAACDLEYLLIDA